MNDVQMIAIAGRNALAELNRLRAESRSTGLFPILLGDAEDRERALEPSRAEFARELGRGLPVPAETLRRSLAIDPAAWMEEKRQLDPELYSAADGDWPRSADTLGIMTHADVLTGEPKQEVFIALLKLNAPWEAFAHLNWGEWNDCPDPAAHCALHRSWAARYGSEVVSITGDVVQCVVARPPHDRATSLQLAHEQYTYCSDIVDQGTQTMANLAASLLNGKYWYFWWD